MERGYKTNESSQGLSKTSTTKSERKEEQMKGIAVKPAARIPQITSLEVAVRLYYEKIELCNSDVRELFGCKSSTTIARLKKQAREKMADNGTIIWNAQHVNTKDAYEAWGLNIENLEYRLKRLNSLSKAK